MGKGSPPAKKSGGGSPKSAPAKSGPGVVDSLVMARKVQIETLWEKAPEKVRPFVVAYAVQLATAAAWAERTGIPFCVLCFEYCKKGYAKLEPHYNAANLSDILPAIVGFLLCFFGGTFPLFIASFEAFRMAGYEGMRKALKDLFSEGEKAVRASQRDSQEDLDGDGIPDVEQISPRELMTRKVLLLLRTVDPNKVTTAITCLNTGLLAVLATLKMSFAQAVSLGASLAELMVNVFDKRARPAVKKMVAEEYHQWIQPAVGYLTKIIAVSIAFALQRIVSAFHSAVRGGQMCGGGLVRFANRKGWIKFDEEDSYLDEAVGYWLWAVGFLFQLANWFGLPFPFNWLLFPITMLEYSLSATIAWF